MRWSWTWRPASAAPLTSVPLSRRGPKLRGAAVTPRTRIAPRGRHHVRHERDVRRVDASGGARVARVLRLEQRRGRRRPRRARAARRLRRRRLGRRATRSSSPAPPRARCSWRSPPAAPPSACASDPARRAPPWASPRTSCAIARVALEELWGAEARELAERMAGAPPAERLAALASAVARRLDGARDPDPLVARASTLLARGVPVTAASRAVALTDRHLRRRFHDAVGYGPKTLQRVMRLRRFLALAEADARPRSRARRGRGGLRRPAAPHARVHAAGGPAARGAAGGARRGLAARPR